MVRRDIVVVGASTGGVDVLLELVSALPAGLPASLFVVRHFPANWNSVLPEILSRAGPLLARHATDGETFYPGHIYVAPPDRHLLLESGGRMKLSRGPRENHHRPAADPLFRSAARHYGPRTIGVVLTGALYDGAAGLLAIRSAGGLAVVQDPRDALVAAMPQSAAQIAGADHIVQTPALAPLLVDLIQRPMPAKGTLAMPDPIEKMPETVLRDMTQQIRDGRRGEVTVFTCPECGGSLWQVDENDIIRFRCHVGHAYNGETLLAEQSESLEAALWTAVRTFKEQCVLARQLAERARTQNNPEGAARFDEQAELAERYSSLIQKYLLGNGATSANPTEVPEGSQPSLPAAGGTR